MTDAKSQLPLIVVTGATGAQGGSVVQTLLQENKWKIRAVSRDPNSEKAKALAAQGVEVVKANLSNKSEVRVAFKGAYGVFGVTSFWDPQVLTSKDYSDEAVQATNIVDAAAECKVKHLVFSALDDVRTKSGGKIVMPHFSNKWDAYQRALKTEIATVTAFFAGWYASNVINFGASRLASDGVVEFGWAHCRADVAVPVYDAQNDTGMFVCAIFNNPAKYNKKIVRSGTYITFPQMAEAFAKVTGKPARFFQLTPEECQAQKIHPELIETVDGFNALGYYLGADLTDVKKEFPRAVPWEGWLWRSGWHGPTK